MEDSFTQKKNKIEAPAELMWDLSSLALTADRCVTMVGDRFVYYMGLDKLHTYSVDYYTTETLKIH